MKLTLTTLRLIEQLAEDERQQLEAKIAEYVRMCRKNSAPMESMDRVVIEGIEIMRLEQRLPLPADAQYEDRHYCYPQYVSPKGDF